MQKKNAQKENFIVRKAQQLTDIEQIAKINREVFAGSGTPEKALSWIHTLWKAEPIYQYYVIVSTSDPLAVLGYAGWQIHGGWDRIEPLMELDQIGIAGSAQGKGLGEKLIRSCIANIAPWLAKRSSRCEKYVSAVVWGYADNTPAMKLYGKIFAEGVCGERTQFEDRKEYMYRLRVPITI